jgi:hypothetical protein
LLAPYDLNEVNLRGGNERPIVNTDFNPCIWTGCIIRFKIHTIFAGVIHSSGKRISYAAIFNSARGGMMKRPVVSIFRIWIHLSAYNF